MAGETSEGACPSPVETPTVVTQAWPAWGGGARTISLSPGDLKVRPASLNCELGEIFNFYLGLVQISRGTLSFLVCLALGQG